MARRPPTHSRAAEPRTRREARAERARRGFPRRVPQPQPPARARHASRRLGAQPRAVRAADRALRARRAARRRARGGGALAPATVTQMLDHLAESGHVERVRSEADRRVVVCRLTPHGRRRIEAKRAAWQGRWDGALAGLSARRAPGGDERAPAAGRDGRGAASGAASRRPASGPE